MVARLTYIQKVKGSSPLPPTRFLFMADWVLYILRCSDGSLYTGITNDLEKRLKWHNEGKASKYTRSKRPVKLVYSESLGDESSARKREAEVKNLSRQQKLELIK